MIRKRKRKVAREKKISSPSAKGQRANIYL